MKNQVDFKIPVTSLSENIENAIENKFLFVKSLLTCKKYFI